MVFEGYAKHKALLTMISCQSVCLSVCPSVCLSVRLAGCLCVRGVFAFSLIIKEQCLQISDYLHQHDQYNKQLCLVHRNVT